MQSVLTGSGNVTLLEEIPAARLIASYRKEYAIDVAGGFAGVDTVSRYRCNDTGLAFFTPAAIAAAGEFYEHLQQLPFYYRAEKWEYPLACAGLRGSAAVLEVGCGAGHFLKFARRNGLPVQGIELNAQAAAQAAAAGLDVSNQSLDGLRRAGRRFDAICAFHVLEHVPDPGAFIRDIVSLTRAGGKIVFAVPNSAGYEGLGYDLLQYPPHHMSLWTPTVFRALPSLYPVRLDKLVCERLAGDHVRDYVAWNVRDFRRHSPRFRWVLNRVTIPVIRWLLRAGLRKICTGHAVYVQFTKI